MERFYESKELLQEAEVALNRVTYEYKTRINNLDYKSLKAAELVYAYKKFKTKYLIQTKNKELIDENKKKIHQEFSIYIRDKFGIDCPAGKIEELINLANEKAEPVLVAVEKYKKELTDTYSTYSGVLRHATNVPNLSKITASKGKENQYMNEMVDGVFASSGYSDLENYIGRANVSGMQVMNDIVVYSDNPFIDKKRLIKDGSVPLKDKVYLYQMDATKFEPVVDFGKDEYGSYCLKFDQEWICRNNEIKCECEVIDSLPRDAFERKQFFYKKEGIDVRQLLKGPQEEVIQHINQAIKEDKLEYINAQVGIGVSKLIKTKNISRLQEMLQKIKKFLTRNKFKKLPANEIKLADETSIKSWDLQNWKSSNILKMRGEIQEQLNNNNSLLKDDGESKEPEGPSL